MLRALGPGCMSITCGCSNPLENRGVETLSRGISSEPHLPERSHYWALCVSKTIPEDVEAMKEKMKPEMEDFHQQVR